MNQPQPTTLAREDRDTLTAEASLGLMYDSGRRAGLAEGRMVGRAEAAKTEYERGEREGKRRGINAVLRILQRQALVEAGLTYETDDLYLEDR